MFLANPVIEMAYTRDYQPVVVPAMKISITERMGLIALPAILHAGGAIDHLKIEYVI